MSLGEVEGVFQASLSQSTAANARSSRRGKEQIRSKASKEVPVRRSDLRVGADPWNGAREILRASNFKHSKCKCTRL